jgi:hypothetical protein
MRRALRGLVALASAWAALPAASALAAVPIELDWQAPPGCSSRERVLEEVGRLTATPPPEPLHARAVVTRGGNAYRVVIELDGAARGARALQAPSCDSVARATALIIALAIDPQAATVAVEPPVDAPPRAPPTEAPEPQATPARPLAVFATLGLVVERALLPDFAAGAEAGAGLRWRFLRADVSAGVLPSATTELPDRPSVSGHFTLGYLALRGCAGVVGDGVSTFGCAGLRGSRIWARGDGDVRAFEHAAHALSLEPGALLRTPDAGGLAAEFAANLVIPLSRPTFVIVDDDTRVELFRPPALGVAVRAGLSYEF